MKFNAAALVAIVAGNFLSYKQPTAECSCDCCLVAPRNAAEIEDPAAPFKCAMKQSSDSCATECTDPWGQVLTASAVEAVSMERYCFLSCRPYDDQLDGHCIKLDSGESGDVMERDGNGQDGNFPPDLPVIAAAPTAPPVPAADVTPEPPCEMMRPCIYGAQDEQEQKAREAYKNVHDVAEAVRKLTG